MKILVAGATGNVGPTLVAHLLRAGEDVRVLARDPEKAARLLGPDVEVVRGNLGEPARLASAFRGVQRAFLATAPSPTLADEEVSFIDAAQIAGLERLVKLSGFGIEFSNDRIHGCHARSEERLRSSEIPSVVLRPAVFMSNLLFDATNIKAGKLPSIFADSRISFVDPRDVAEVAARTLLSSADAGQTLGFGGPEALSYDAIAATLSRVLGRPIEHVRLDEATFTAAALGAGLPDFVIEAVTGMATSAREGKYEVTDEVVRSVLGRPASNLADWIERHREALTPLREQ